MRLQPGLLRLRQVTFGPEIHQRNLHEVVDLILGAEADGWRRWEKIGNIRTGIYREWAKNGEDQFCFTELISTMFILFYYRMLATLASQKHPINWWCGHAPLRIHTWPWCTRWFIQPFWWILVVSRHVPMYPKVGKAPFYHCKISKKYYKSILSWSVLVYFNLLFDKPWQAKIVITEVVLG